MFADTVGTGRPIPLQCPDSLAVDANNHIIPLDAEFLPTGLIATDAATQEAYKKWFGADCDGFASSIEAALLHRKALRQYFREVLSQMRSHVPPRIQTVLHKVDQRFDRLPANLPGDELDQWVQQNQEEDWDLPVDEVAYKALQVSGKPPRQEAVPATTSTPERPASFSRKAGILLFLASLLLNLLLATIIAGFVAFWLKPKARNEPNPPQAQDDLLFSSYCVVFPTEGTSSAKVKTSLDKLFPQKTIELSEASKDRDQLLKDKMTESVNSIKELERVKSLLWTPCHILDPIQRVLRYRLKGGIERNH